MIDREKDAAIGYICMCCAGIGCCRTRAHTEQTSADSTSEGNDELTFVFFPIEPEITGLSIVKKKKALKGKKKKSNNMGLISDVSTTRGCQNCALMDN